MLFLLFTTQELNFRISPCIHVRCHLLTKLKLYMLVWLLSTQELNQRAQGEVTIREAIRELDLWGAGAVFTLTEYEDSSKNTIHLIKDWKDLVNQVTGSQPYTVWSRKVTCNKVKLQNVVCCFSYIYFSRYFVLKIWKFSVTENHLSFKNSIYNRKKLLNFKNVHSL